MQCVTLIFLTGSISQNFQFGFSGFSKRWLGAPATIAPKKGAVVYGAVYELDLVNLADLDWWVISQSKFQYILFYLSQENVKEGVYIPISVPVESKSGEVLMCRAYQLANIPEEWDSPSAQRENQPSATYLKTIVKGAVETKLPVEYIKFLKSFEHNGNIVDDFEFDLDLRKFSLCNVLE